MGEWEVRVNIPVDWVERFVMNAISHGGILFLFRYDGDGSFCIGWRFASKQWNDAFYDWTSEIFSIGSDLNFCHWWMCQDVRWKKAGHESSKYLW